jgi:hypothetical protein
MTVLEHVYNLTDGKLQLSFHAGQSEAWDSTAHTTAVIAGTQSGKTSFGPWWLYREIYGMGDWAGRGAGDYLGVTASYDLFKLKMLPELRTVFEHILRVGRYWAGDKVLELKDPMTGLFWATTAADPMWGRIILRSANAPGGLESATALAAWLDEAGHDDFTLTAMEAIWRRLSLSRGRILITTTPYNLGWLKQQIFDKWQRGDRDIRVIQFKSTMNPRFDREEFEKARTRLPGWKFRMFYEGQFERPAGMIYSDFSDAPRERGGHKMEAVSLPVEFPRYVGIDPGLENQGRIWLAHDIQHEVWIVYRAERPTKRSTREHAADCLATARQSQENVVVWAVGAKPEEQQRLEWREAGLYAVEPPFHDVEVGLDRVISLLRQHRLFFCEDNGVNGMNGLFDEIATYSRVLDDAGNPTDKIKNKEQYHLLDALRYGVAALGEVYEDAGGINQGESYSIG